MPLNYDPMHVLGFVPKAGVYPFRIMSCAPMTFSSGSQGIRLQLEVQAGAPAPLHCWDNIVFGERTTWKMHDLCVATKVRFDPPCDDSDLVDQTGRAEFTTDEWDGFIRLKVVRYLPPEREASTPDRR